MLEGPNETHLTVARHEGVLEGILVTLQDIKEELKANRFWNRVAVSSVIGLAVSLVVGLLILMQFVAKAEVADVRTKVSELERRVGVTERQIETYHQPTWSSTGKIKP